MPHTPGPWNVTEDQREAVARIRSKDGDAIADVYGLDSEPFEEGTDEGKANALLIRAAPELFEVLEEFLDLECDDDGDRIVPPGFCDKARAVIAKAKSSS